MDTKVSSSHKEQIEAVILSIQNHMLQNVKVKTDAAEILKDLDVKMQDIDANNKLLARIHKSLETSEFNKAHEAVLEKFDVTIGENEGSNFSLFSRINEMEEQMKTFKLMYVEKFLENEELKKDLEQKSADEVALNKIHFQNMEMTLKNQIKNLKKILQSKDSKLEELTQELNEWKKECEKRGDEILQLKKVGTGFDREVSVKLLEAAEEIEMTNRVLEHEKMEYISEQKLFKDSLTSMQIHHKQCAQEMKSVKKENRKLKSENKRLERALEEASPILDEITMKSNWARKLSRKKNKKRAKENLNSPYYPWLFVEMKSKRHH